MKCTVNPYDTPTENINEVRNKKIIARKYEAAEENTCRKY